jgi:arylsulfatase A-like enzyme
LDQIYQVAKFASIPDTRRQYVAAMAAIMDEGVGNLTESLKRNGVENSTVVIFTSDNGEWYGHSWYGMGIHGPKCYNRLLSMQLLTPHYLVDLHSGPT